jgi:pimeloyl-ACP methyl ester carboxylesterase
MRSCHGYHADRVLTVRPRLRQLSRVLLTPMNPITRAHADSGARQTFQPLHLPRNNLEGSTVTNSATLSSPYHVQTTADTLRNGFPYFTHHDSVSALWAKKWRTPCAAGIYPFTDANVADFDPIFAELVKTSNDDSGILYRPDDYAKPFLPVGQELAAKGGEAQSSGRSDEARDLFLRAAAVYRIARFPIPRSPLGQQAWQNGKAAYERGGALLDPPSRSVAIPFNHVDVNAGDDDTPVEAYLRLPKGVPPKAGWPVLLFVCGLDAYRTDHTPRTQQHVDHGFATLSFEIPGTGDSPAAPNDPTSPDRLMSSVLDWVTSTASQYNFDVKRVLARGISTGGYYAFRVAHTHADRLFAVVAQGGGCHYMFSSEWIRAQDQMEYPFALAEALAYKFGYRDSNYDAAVASYAAEASKFSLLNAGIVETSSCKLLVIDGMEDSIFPIEDNFIVATKGGKKDLVARGDRGHMGNPGAEEILYQWIDNAVAGKP